MLNIEEVRDLSCLGRTEDEILSSICTAASRYLAGSHRPLSALKTEDQQRKAMEAPAAALSYLSFCRARSERAAKHEQEDHT